MTEQPLSPTTATNTEPEADVSRPAQLLTVAEAAVELRVSRWMLYRLIQTRQLNTLTIGRRRFIPRDELDRFLANRRREGAAQ